MFTTEQNCQNDPGLPLPFWLSGNGSVPLGVRLPHDAEPGPPGPPVLGRTGLAYPGPDLGAGSPRRLLPWHHLALREGRRGPCYQPLALSVTALPVTRVAESSEKPLNASITCGVAHNSACFPAHHAFTNPLNLYNLAKS